MERRLWQFPKRMSPSRSTVNRLPKGGHVSYCLLVVHRGRDRRFRRPEAIAERCEHRRALRDHRRINCGGSIGSLRRHFLSCPDRKARRSKVIPYERADRPYVISRGMKQGALTRGDTGRRALVVGNLADVVGNRTERPLADGLGRGEVRMAAV